MTTKALVTMVKDLREDFRSLKMALEMKVDGLETKVEGLERTMCGLEEELRVERAKTEAFGAEKEKISEPLRMVDDLKVEVPACTVDTNVSYLTN